MFSIQNPIVILMSVVLGVPMLFYIIGRIRLYRKASYMHMGVCTSRYQELSKEIDTLKLRYGIEIPPMKAKFDEDSRKTQKLSKATIRKVGKGKN